MNRLPSKRSICNVTPYLPRYLHWKIKKKIWKCVCWMCWVLRGGLKEYGYISFVMGGRNGQAERYLHFSDRCILCHRGVQLILAYSWARPAIVEVGKGRGGMFLFLLFLPFHSCSSFFPVPLFHLFYYLFYLFSPFLWETTQNDPQGLMCR